MKAARSEPRASEGEKGSSMSQKITIFGFGPVGRETAKALVARGDAVNIAQRNAPRDLPAGASFVACDALEPDFALRAAEGSDQIVVAIGFPYDGSAWRKCWPLAMTHFLAACAQTKARMVFVDNLYMYGPQEAPLREDMPLTDFGVKPAVRAAVTRLWRAESAAARVRVAAVRAPDFYGPGVDNAILGKMVFAPLAKNQRIFLLAPPDTPHDFAYVPDVARAVVTLLDAPDDAFGEAWHMPCAPTQTPREIIGLAAKALGVTPKITPLPLFALPLLGLTVPVLREVNEMRFLWDRPYRVDAQKFSKRFWSDATPFETGAVATATYFWKN